jgi:hypothetical protein
MNLLFLRMNAAPQIEFFCAEMPRSYLENAQKIILFAQELHSILTVLRRNAAQQTNAQ